MTASLLIALLVAKAAPAPAAACLPAAPEPGLGVVDPFRLPAPKATELNSGVPDQRATDGAPARSGPAEGGPARGAEPVCRDDHGRATAERYGVAGEVVRGHG